MASPPHTTRLSAVAHCFMRALDPLGPRSVPLYDTYVHDHKQVHDHKRCAATAAVFRSVLSTCMCVHWR